MSGAVLMIFVGCVRLGAYALLVDADEGDIALMLRTLGALKALLHKRTRGELS